MVNNKTKHRTLLIFGIAMCIALILGVLAWKQLVILEQLQSKIDQSQNSLLILQETLSAAKDAESGQRGFLVTADARYLEPYQLAQATINHSMQKLSDLAAKDVVQTGLIRNLSIAIDKKFSELTETIHLCQTSRRDAALARVKDNSGHYYMSEIRSVARDMQQHEQEILANTVIAKEAETKTFLYLFIFWVLYFLSLISLFAHSVMKHWQQLSVANSMLDQRTSALASSNADLIVLNTDLKKLTEQQITLNESLETRVQERTTELIILNSQLSEAKDIAQNASRLKSEFVATMSHEIRTPMNAVIGMTNVLLKTRMDKQQLHYCNAIKVGGNALLAIINDVLDFSKIETGKLELELVDFDPVWLVESVSDLFAMQARGKDLSLMTFIDPAMPMKLCGDPDRLRQILTNLVGNAIKFCNYGEIVIRADVQSIDSSGVIVKFAVRDHGIGLSLEQQKQLFQPFVQLSTADTKILGGTGLGLSICKRLVELMKGKISVESTEGIGSTFSFVIPLEQRSDVFLLEGTQELHGVRVLVVDDEAEAREILHNYVVAWGMRNGKANSGEEAMQVLHKAHADGDPYRVVIIDLLMPESDGINLARQVDIEPALKSTALLLLTAFPTIGLRKLATDAGFTGYLTKPVKQAELRNSLLGVVRGSASAMSDTDSNAKLECKSIRPEIIRSGIILIAEDHPINQQVAQLYLDELGFACQVVNNGLEAVQAAKSDDYSIVLMDCQMPEMDGFQATMAIRKNEELSGRHIPIIAMTANAMKGDRERCLAAGMDDYLSKPVEIEELKSVVTKWMPEESSSLQTLVVTDPCAPELKFATGPYLDMQVLGKRFSPDNLRALLSMFCSQMPIDLDRMQQAVKAFDRDALERTSHSLRGVFSVIGSSNMTQICKVLEQQASENRWDLTPATLEVFERHLESILREASHELTLMKL